MRRKINYKMLLCLLATTVVVTGSLFVVHHFQSKRIARALLWQANRAEDQDQLDRMSRYLERYLQFAPDDLASSGRLGKLWASDSFAGNYRARHKAVSILETVLRTDSERADLRRLLVKAALEIGQHKTARDHLQAMLEENGIPHGKMTEVERGEVECYWGQLCEAEKDKSAQAVAWYRVAVRHAPEAPIAYVRLAWLLRAEAKKENEPLKAKAAQVEADQLLDQLVEKNAESAQAYLARWRYRREFELINLEKTPTSARIALTDAAEDVARALQRAPDSVEILLAAADVERLKFNHDREQNPDGRKEARRHLTRGLELQAKLGVRGVHDPAQFQLLYQLTNILLDERQDPQTAPEEYSALVTEAASRITQLRRTRLRPASIIPAVADYLQARIHIINDEYPRAEPLLTRSRTVLEKQVDLGMQINLLLGACYHRLENPVGMLDSFNRVLKEDPNSMAALQGVAAAQSKLGQLDKSLQSYQMLMNQKKAPSGGWLDLARLEMQKQLRSERTVRKWEPAVAALRKAETSLPNTPERERAARLFDITLLNAEILTAQDRADEAERLLIEARDSQKEKRGPYWAALIELAEYRKDRAKAKALLAAAEKEPDDVELRLVRARLLTAEKGEGWSALLDAQGNGAEQFLPEEQARLFAGLAEVWFRAGNVAKARANCKRLASNPLHLTDLRLRLFVFDLALQEDSEEALQEALKDIRTVEDSVGPFTRFASALLKIRAARPLDQKERAKLLEEASRDLDVVAEARPYWSKLAIARAEVCAQRGQPELAIDELRKAIAGGENTPNVVGKLVSTLYERQRYQEAFQELQKARQTLQANSDLHRLAASLALWKEQPLDALKHAQQAVEAETSNFRDLVWLGQMLDATDNSDEGLKKLRRAVELAPTDPGPHVALVQTLAGRGREGEARALIKSIEAKVDPARRPLALAQCFEALNDPAQAAKCYDAALHLQAGDIAVLRAVVLYRLRTNRIDGAEQVLQRIVRGEVQASEDDKTWARQTLAVVLANGTDFARFQQALALAGVKVDDDGHPVHETGKVSIERTEAVLTRARVLAMQPMRPFRERAVELFENLDRSQALTPNDKFILAMLYEAGGQWPKTQEQLDYLVVQYPGAQQYLAQYVQLLLQHGDTRRAEVELKKLEELETRRAVGTNVFGTENLRAMLLEKTGQKDEALALIRKAVGRRGTRPDAVVVLLAALARAEKFAEAFDLCEETWRKQPDNKVRPEVLGGATVSLLRSMKPTDEQVTRLEGCLKRAIAANADRMVLRLHLADLYDLRARYPEAEALYREVLAKEPNNAIALNNLAWLLSHQGSRNEEALALIGKSIQGFGRRLELLDTRAMVLLRMGRTDEALADLREVTMETPSAPRLFHLARAQHAVRDREATVKTLRQAKALGLTADQLHPVEQEACRKLMEEYRVQ